MQDEPEGLTQRQAAERIGKSQPWISRMVQAGELRLLPGGRIDPQSLVTIDTSSRKRSAGPVRSSGGLTLVQARLEREKWNGRQAALDYHERVRNLVAMKDVEAAQIDVARRVRERFLGVAARVAPDIVGLGDARIIESRLRRVLLDELRELTEMGELPPAIDDAAAS